MNKDGVTWDNNDDDNNGSNHNFDNKSNNLIIVTKTVIRINDSEDNLNRGKDNCVYSSKLDHNIQVAPLKYWV